MNRLHPHTVHGAYQVRARVLMSTMLGAKFNPNLFQLFTDKDGIIEIFTRLGRDDVVALVKETSLDLAKAIFPEIHLILVGFMKELALVGKADLYEATRKLDQLKARNQLDDSTFTHCKICEFTGTSVPIFTLFYSAEEGTVSIIGPQ